MDCSTNPQTTGTNLAVASTSSMQLAPSVNDIRAMMNALRSSAMSALAATIPNSGRGCSFPMKFSYSKKNANTIPGAHDSWSVFATLGSFANIKPSSTMLPCNNGECILIPISLSEKNKKTSVYPVSRYTGEPILYTVLHRGKQVLMFCNTAPSSDIGRGTTVYAYSATATLSRRDAEGQQKTFKALSELLRDNPAQLADKMPTCGPNIWKAHGSVNIDPPAWYKPTEWAHMIVPPMDVVMKYVNKELDLDVARCLELEFIELAVFPGKLGEIPTVSLRCDLIARAVPVSYKGQERADTLEMVQHDEKSGSNHYEILQAIYEQTTNRESTAIERIVGVNLLIVPMDEDDEIPHAIDTTGNCSHSSPKGQFDKDVPVLITLKNQENRPTMVIKGNILAWPKEETLYDARAMGRCLSVGFTCRVFEDEIKATTGFDSNCFEAWKSFTQIFFQNPPTFALDAQVDVARTKLLISSATANPEFPSVELRCINFWCDMIKWIENNAIPITTEYAMKRILGAGVFGGGAAIPLTDLPDVINFASKDAINYIALAREHCSFYALPLGKAISASIIEQLTKEAGDAIMDPSWRQRCEVIVPLKELTRNDDDGEITSTRIVQTKTTPNTTIRRDTQIESADVVFWAIRNDCSAKRSVAHEAYAIFTSGGKYDENGYPIIRSNTTPTSDDGALHHTHQALIADAPHADASEGEKTGTPTSTPIKPVVVVAPTPSTSTTGVAHATLTHKRQNASGKASEITPPKKKVAVVVDKHTSGVNTPSTPGVD